MLTAPQPAAAGAGSAGAGNERAASGLGWVVRPAGAAGGLEWSHAGALEGSNAAWLVRRPDGFALAFVFNSLPEDFGAFFPEATDALTGAAGAVRTWPAQDLFGSR
jgi:hypothetical protein